MQESIADEFVAALVKFAKELVVGCAYDPKTQLGPVVSAEHQRSVTEWITKGVEEGAKLVLDGRNCVVDGYKQGFFVGPTSLIMQNLG